MQWVDSAVNDQRLSQAPNPTGYIWDEVHPPNGPPGWDPQRYWQWEDARLLLTFIPSSSMGGKWGVGKKEMCHRPHGVLITITKHGEQKKLVIGHEKPPTTPT